MAAPRSASGRRLWAALGGLAAILALAGLWFAQARSAGSPDVVPPPGTIASILKGPYLQGLGPTGVTVKVEISVPAPARLEVYLAGEATPVVVVASAAGAAGDRRFHLLRADGLLPATTYDYFVSAGGVISDKGRFTTAPSDARPFRFLVYGDNRTDADAHAAVVRAMTGVAVATASTQPVSFLINTGDMVHRGPDPADWRSFFAVEGKLLRDTCLFAAVGNHELYRGDHDGEVAFLRYFGAVEEGRPLDRLYGSFRWSNTRFFMLNAMDTWTGAERDWLRAELDRALTEPGLAHRIAVMHWGPFSAGPHGNNPALASGDVITLMRDRKVDLVFAGHDHVYERGTGAGLKYIITGGGGAPLYKKKYDLAETQAFEPAYHFVEVSIDGDRVRTTSHRASGGLIEVCGFAGPGAWDCAGAAAAALPEFRVRAAGRRCWWGSAASAGPRARAAVRAARAPRRRTWWTRCSPTSGCGSGC